MRLSISRAEYTRSRVHQCVHSICYRRKAFLSRAYRLGVLYCGPELLKILMSRVIDDRLKN